MSWRSRVWAYISVDSFEIITKAMRDLSDSTHRSRAQTLLQL